MRTCSFECCWGDNVKESHIKVSCQCLQTHFESTVFDALSSRLTVKPCVYTHASLDRKKPTKMDSRVFSSSLFPRCNWHHILFKLHPPSALACLSSSSHSLQIWIQLMTIHHSWQVHTVIYFKQRALMLMMHGRRGCTPLTLTAVHIDNRFFFILTTAGKIKTLSVLHGMNTVTNTRSDFLYWRLSLLPTLQKWQGLNWNMMLLTKCI